MLLLILTKSNAFMDKKFSAFHFYSLLKNVLTYHPSLSKHVRYIFSFPIKPSLREANFFVFLAKSKINVLCLFCL